MTMARLACAAALASLVCIGVVHSQQQPPPPPSPTQAPASQVFRGGTDTVSLSVTVVDTQGRHVSGLTKDDFQVLEDFVPQRIETFAGHPQPIALSVLMDTSTSMEQTLTIAQQAAIGFAKRLGPSDLAQIIDFDSSIVILQEFTRDQALLETAIKRTRAGGSTALYHAIYTALDEQKRVRARSADELRRQAVVVLSDGEDTSSMIEYEQVLDSAKRSEVVVYAIGLRGKNTVPRRGFNEAEFVLRTLSQETGGRVFFVDDAHQLSSIYSQIADELANQYTIGYTSKNSKRDGTWRRITVNVSAPGATARTKSGYYGPTEKR
jgi:Ca-activated chloride channel family protein